MLVMTKHPRITVSLTDELLRKVDVYWHAKQLNTRNEAFRELISLAFDWALREPDTRQPERRKVR